MRTIRVAHADFRRELSNGAVLNRRTASYLHGADAVEGLRIYGIPGLGPDVCIRAR